jgi:hypothetical protein
MSDNPLTALAIMSPPKPNEPAEIMREANAKAKFEAFERKLSERGGYLTLADTETNIKEFGGSRITSCGVTYEYGTHPLAALAMRERAAKMVVGDCGDASVNDMLLADAIRAMPTTFTDAELLAAAMQLPKVRALADIAFEAKTQLENRAYEGVNFYTGETRKYYGVHQETLSALCDAIATFKKDGER